jgi:hypothetical protein
MMDNRARSGIIRSVVHNAPESAAIIRNGPERPMMVNNRRGLFAFLGGGFFEEIFMEYDVSGVIIETQNPAFGVSAVFSHRAPGSALIVALIETLGGPTG